MKLDIQPILENAKALIEVEVKKVIEAKCDAAVDAAVDVAIEEIKKLVPDWADVMAEGAKPQLKAKLEPVIKAQLLGLADQISDKV